MRITSKRVYRPQRKFDEAVYFYTSMLAMTGSKEFPYLVSGFLSALIAAIFIDAPKNLEKSAQDRIESLKKEQFDSTFGF